ncbi:hypothetical protein W97_08636 [Coniosporium apollinis CBS 100218]|uniref:Uncharacterized protein n=1 Tax=Coniosporium apollinis (strain CBS 100218) TaxID=1168221 RepID=R7Z612_CONA1|nr:uncharacterized protein W97_08636 [Coniosporium apollinis CBS 100218]EON69376.1 hypothetical protein W97_08636 [Coniosporium apollinis CBS 100218]
MHEIEEESPDQTSPKKTGPGLSGTRALPRPPSASIFAPDVKLNPTSLRAALTLTSPTLSLASYKQGSNDSYFSSASPNRRASVRFSATSSIFSIPAFPSPAKTNPSLQVPPPPVLELTRPSTDTDRSEGQEYSLSPQPSPLDPEKIRSEQDESPIDPILQYPKLDVSPLRLQPKEEQSDDFTTETPAESPPCSPKTLRPPSFIAAATDLPKTPSLSPRNNPFDELVMPPATRIPTPPAIAIGIPKGPREQPPRDLRRAVLQLRRMNSEATIESRADRRYLYMGRAASPSLPELDSCASLTAAFEPVPEAADEGETFPKGGDEEGRSKRNSVWENGEMAWKQADVGMKEKRRSDSASPVKMAGALGTEVVTPKVRVVPASVQGTPGSLYDQNGFLKT